MTVTATKPVMCDVCGEIDPRVPKAHIMIKSAPAVICKLCEHDQKRPA